MKVFYIILQVAIIYGIYLIGSYIQSFFNLFIPGSIIGMVLLFILLNIGIVKEKWLVIGSNFLLTHLALFFLPVTVGVINHLSLFTGKGLLAIFAVILSTIIVMVVSGFIGQFYANKKEGELWENEGSSL
ncbi:CidA/LrgA family protein [Bacillus timonensis]|nr:CidA/LrgA family protein [Bacillus timonensis]